MSSDLIEFYLGAGPDHRGRRIADIWEWPDEELERVHDYIQWLFPLREKSGFNLNAPVLDEVAVSEFRRRPDLKQNLRRSLQRMLEFYGLDPSGDEPTRAEDAAGRLSVKYNERLREWVTYGNHNHLRITRILKSLSELGLNREANDLFRTLEEIYRNEERKEFPGISEDTFRFWQGAISQR
jgi:hypothetical protein